jgi:hypothetical protein
MRLVLPIWQFYTTLVLRFGEGLLLLSLQHALALLARLFAHRTPAFSLCLSSPMPPHWHASGLSWPLAENWAENTCF